MIEKLRKNMHKRVIRSIFISGKYMLKIVWKVLLRGMISTPKYKCTAKTPHHTPRPCHTHLSIWAPSSLMKTHRSLDSFTQKEDTCKYETPPPSRVSRPRRVKNVQSFCVKAESSIRDWNANPYSLTPTDSQSRSTVAVLDSTPATSIPLSPPQHPRIVKIG